MSGPLATSEEASDDVTAAVAATVAVSFLVLSLSSHFSQEIEFRLLFHSASSVLCLVAQSSICPLLSEIFECGHECPCPSMISSRAPEYLCLRMCIVLPAHTRHILNGQLHFNPQEWSAFLGTRSRSPGGSGWRPRSSAPGTRAIVTGRGPTL